MRILLSINIIIISLLIVSCTGKKGPRQEVVTLNFLCEPNRIREKQIELFEKTHPNIKVKMDVVPQGIFEKELTMIAGGVAPDVFFMMDKPIADFARRGIIEDLSSFIEKDKDFDIDAYFTPAIEAYSYQGKPYALPGNISPFIIYYNKNIFDREGVNYPDETWTWDGFLDAARKLTKRDEKERIIQFGAYIGDILDVFILQAGGRIFGEDGKRCIINSQEVLYALRFLNDLTNVHHVTLVRSEEHTMGGSQGMPLFMMRKSAMHISGRWHTLTFREAKDLDFRIAPLFREKKRSTIMNSMGWAMSSQSKHKEESWELMKFLSGREGTKFVVEEGDGLPPLISMLKEESFLYDPRYPNEDNEVYLKSMTYAFPSLLINPYIPVDLMSSILGAEIEKYIRGRVTAEDALSTIEKSMNQQLAKAIK